MQDHERPMLGRRVHERAVERVPVVEKSEVVVGRRRLERLAVHLDHPSLTATGLVDGCVDEQPVEPAVEVVGIAQAGKVAPGADERLLDRVARELAIAEDQTRCRVEPCGCGAGQARRRRRDRPPVPAPRTSAGPRPTLEVARLTWPRSHGMATGSAHSFRSRPSDVPVGVLLGGWSGGRREAWAAAAIPSRRPRRRRR